MGCSRNCCQVTVDIGIYIAVSVGLVLCFIYGEPYQRGFFCDDESIRHPFYRDSVTAPMLIGFGLVVPLAAVVCLECAGAYQEAYRGKRLLSLVAYRFGKVYGLFLYGLLCTSFVTEVIKLSSGTMRPHFIEVCGPDWKNINCSEGYVRNFNCTNPNTSIYDKRNSRKSFCSGHASTAVFVAVYTGVYIQRRFTHLSMDMNTILLKTVLQMFLACTAIYTCVSRVTDFMHHWTDVLFGGILGGLMAVWLVVSLHKQYTFLNGQKPRQRSFGMTPMDDKEDSYGVP